MICCRFLNMSFNLLRSLPRSGFEGLETLETVDLSFNDLREIDERAFDNLPWLATLKVTTRRSKVAHVLVDLFEKCCCWFY